MGAITRRVVLPLILAIAIGFTGASPATAAWDDVVFEGSGWGHGVGLSQWGALAMANQGKTYQQILAHYFRGTSLQTVAPSTTLWVNLERNFATKTLQVLHTDGHAGANIAVSGGVGDIVAKQGASIVIAPIEVSGCRLTVNNPGEPPIVRDDPSGCTVDFKWYDWTTPGATPTTKVQIAGCTLPDWNNPGGTKWRPCEYAYGTLHLRWGEGGFDLSAEMLIDDYVRGISEVPYSWTNAALQAQAVAARSYAEGRRIARGNPATNSCDGWCHVKDTTSDQRYVGWGHYNAHLWSAITNTTARQVLTHPASSTGVITAYYSSSTGGATEFGHLVGYSNGPVEWLTSVDDSWAVNGSVNNPNRSWSVVKTESDIAALLGWDYLTSVQVISRRPGSSSAAQVEFRGMKAGNAVSVIQTSQWVVSNMGLKSHYFDVDFRLAGEEMFFYNQNGSFRYEDVNPDGSLGPPILTGTGYTTGWRAITAVDLEGDGRDEMFFYRGDGLFRYYDIGSNASIGSPIAAGSGYTTNWDAITAVDLDGDGQDEMFFYRADGLFRYYQIKPDGQIGSPIAAGSGYTTGWDSIAAVDLDGDGQDEMFFYRADGLFRYYDIRPNGTIGSPIAAGSGYTKDWDAITAVDLDGDGQDEMFFYRADGLYRYYQINPNGSIGSPIKAGDTYFHDWSSVTSIELNGS
jgi:SpoIID/LytB domain protein